MSFPLKKITISSRTQLDIIAFFSVVLMGGSAWLLMHPLTWGSIIPLTLILFASLRVIFELTINRKNVPTMATSLAGQHHVLEILKRETAQFQGKCCSIIDLGSGRGQLARKTAKALPYATVLGLETGRIPYAQAMLFLRLFGPKNLSFRRCDFFQFDCSNADAVYFYLSPRVNQKVGKKLFDELKPGSLVLSHMFPLPPEWTPEETLIYHAPFKETIFVYRKK